MGLFKPGFKTYAKVPQQGAPTRLRAEAGNATAAILYKSWH
ncbi:hypothetical protein [Glaciimonas soli]|nr:hypothetical protein [Glaciimonas soli]